MSLLGQISIGQIGRIRTIGHAPSYVKGLTYDRVHEYFERPHDALGNRYRNPVARIFDMILGAYLAAQSEAFGACRYQVSRIFDTILDACRRVYSPLARIEIAIRIRPE